MSYRVNPPVVGDSPSRAWNEVTIEVDYPEMNAPQRPDQESGATGSFLTPPRRPQAYARRCRPRGSPPPLKTRFFGALAKHCGYAGTCRGPPAPLASLNHQNHSSWG